MNAANGARKDVDGVLLLNKPRGLSSQQAVARAKRLFAARKAGHTGTLDPMADGLLPIGFGEATKFAQFLLDSDKRYLATVQLGVTTNTGDAEGEILEERPVVVSVEAIDAVLRRCTGPQMQTPPMQVCFSMTGTFLASFEGWTAARCPAGAEGMEMRSKSYMVLGCGRLMEQTGRRMDFHETTIR